MIQTRTVNSMRNIFWSIFYKIIVMILPFLVRTVMIYKLGVEYTGLSNLFTSIISILSLAELGFSNAMIYSMYEPISKNDTNLIGAILAYYKKIYSIIGTFIFVVGIIILPFLSYFIRGNVPIGINIYYLYIIYLLNSVLSFFLFAYKSSLIIAYQRTDLISIAGMVVQILLYLSQIFVLLKTSNFYYYALLIPISTIFINISYEVISIKLFPNIKKGGKIDINLKNKMKKKVFGVMLYKFSSTTRTSFDSLIISSFLGLAILTKYQNYYLIINSILGIFSIVTNSITASVGNSIVTKDIKSNYDDFIKFVFIYMIIAGICTACICSIIQPFMKLWMGSTLLLSNAMAMLFGVYFYSQTIGNIVFVYRTAAGLWWEDRIRPIVEMVLNLVLNIVLVKFFGLYGIISATIFTLLSINFFWGARVLFKYYFNCPMKEYLILQLKQLIITIFISIICFNILRILNLSNLFNKLVLSIMASIFLYYIIYKNNKLYLDSKKFIINICQLIFKKNK